MLELLIYQFALLDFGHEKDKRKHKGGKKKNRRDLGVIKEEEGETTARISRKSTKRRRS
jgi:hypothetical protein